MAGIAEGYVQNNSTSEEDDAYISEQLSLKRIDVSEVAKRADRLLLDRKVFISPQVLFDVADIPKYEITENVGDRLERLLFKAALGLSDNPSESFLITMRMSLRSNLTEFLTYKAKVTIGPNGDLMLTALTKNKRGKITPNKIKQMEPEALRYTEFAWKSLGQQFRPS